MILKGLISGGEDSDVLVMRSKKDGFSRETRFWAERGIICCEDNIDGFSQMSLRTFLRRARALSDMLGKKSQGGEAGADADLRSEIQAQLEKIELIARKCQVQGTPDDASARRDLVRRRKTTMYVSDKAIM